jgi:hypothetical protein
MMGLHKTSDKLLAAMLIAGAGLLCCIHLVLYAEFRSGHVLRWKDIEKAQFVQYRLSRPTCISLTGTIWVNIYPSDSSYIELPRTSKTGAQAKVIGLIGPTADLAMPAFRQNGDTLNVTGDCRIAVHRPFSDWSYRSLLPVVNIYGRGFRDIQILNGQLVLNGSDRNAGATSYRLTAKNSTVWVAEYDEPLQTVPTTKFFDSLDLRMANSVLLLNRAADIRSANISLDGSSELNDRWSTIGRGAIIGSDSSHIALTGNNLKRSTINIH